MLLRSRAGRTLPSAAALFPPLVTVRWPVMLRSGFPSPPFPIDVRLVPRNLLHLLGSGKLVILGMGVPEKHDHPVLALVIVPDMARVVYIPIRMPDPITLNDFRRRPYGNLCVFDRDV